MIQRKFTFSRPRGGWKGFHPPQVACWGVLCLLLLSGVAAANEFEDLPWTQGVGKVLVGDRNLPEAKERALNLARSDAIAQANPEYRIRSTATRMVQESEESYHDFFSRIVRREVSALIVKERRPTFDYVEIADGELQVVCKLEARVAPDDQQRDLGFMVQVKLANRESGIYRTGEEMILEVLPSRDCFVTIFCIYSDGTVSVLIPNKMMQDNHLKGGQIHQFPSEHQQKREGIHFRLTIPDDRDQLQESIQVVATLEEYPFSSFRMSDLGGSYLATFEAAWEELNSWLIRIPANRRTGGEVFYSIVR
jgi:hypothetical protein